MLLLYMNWVKYCDSTGIYYKLHNYKYYTFTLYEGEKLIYIKKVAICQACKLRISKKINI